MVLADALETYELAAPQADFLCLGLAENTSIASVELALHYVSYSELSAEVASCLASALGVNTTLTSLAVTTHDMNILAARALSAAVASNATLTAFRMISAVAEEDIFCSFAEALTGNTSLLSVALHGSFDTPTVLEAFSDTLQNNCTLTSLDIRDHASALATSDVTQALLHRNRELPILQRHVELLATKTANPGLRSVVSSMTEEGFQRAVFANFLPGSASRREIFPGVAPESRDRGFGRPSSGRKHCGDHNLHA